MKSLRSSICWKCLCLAMYVPVVLPGGVGSPMYCVSEGGRVVVEDSRENHCSLAVPPLPHGCCSHTAPEAESLERSCHCGPCIDIEVPVDHHVSRILDLSAGPEMPLLAGILPGEFFSDVSFGSVRTHPPPVPTLKAKTLRTVVLLI